MGTDTTDTAAAGDAEPADAEPVRCHRLTADALVALFEAMGANEPDAEQRLAPERFNSDLRRRAPEIAMWGLEDLALAAADVVVAMHRIEMCLTEIKDDDLPPEVAAAVRPWLVAGAEDDWTLTRKVAGALDDLTRESIDFNLGMDLDAISNDCTQPTSRSEERFAQDTELERRVMWLIAREVYERLMAYSGLAAKLTKLV